MYKLTIGGRGQAVEDKEVTRKTNNEDATRQTGSAMAQETKNEEQRKSESVL